LTGGEPLLYPGLAALGLEAFVERRSAAGLEQADPRRHDRTGLDERRLALEDVRRVAIEADDERAEHRESVLLDPPHCTNKVYAPIVRLARFLQ
jgi:hypothetical protein